MIGWLALVIGLSCFVALAWIDSVQSGLGATGGAFTAFAVIYGLIKDGQ